MEAGERAGFAIAVGFGGGAFAEGLLAGAFEDVFAVLAIGSLLLGTPGCWANRWTLKRRSGRRQNVLCRGTGVASSSPRAKHNG